MLGRLLCTLLLLKLCLILLILLPLHLQQLVLLVSAILILSSHRRLSNANLPLQLLLGLHLRIVAHPLLVDGRGGRLRLDSLLLDTTGDENLLVLLAFRLSLGICMLVVVLVHRLRLLLILCLVRELLLLRRLLLKLLGVILQLKQVAKPVVVVRLLLSIELR